MKLISLLSGGIDSPVATRMMMKKAEIIVAHFHHKQHPTNKIEKIISVLKKYQSKIKAYFLPFEHLNKEVIKNIPANYRMIFYRRGMFKIAEKILEKENAIGFVTGDSIGQVASQTLYNLKVIYEATRYPVLSPLIGLNKEEITDYAKKIGTYNISIEPYMECCSYMIARHPITHAKIYEIRELESKIDFGEIIEKTFSNTLAKNF